MPSLCTGTLQVRETLGLLVSQFSWASEDRQRQGKAGQCGKPFMSLPGLPSPAMAPGTQEKAE